MANNTAEFHRQIHDGQPIIPCCPYCEKQLDGLIIDGMHAKCYDDFGNDLDESFPDEPGAFAFSGPDPDDMISELELSSMFDPF